MIDPIGRPSYRVAVTFANPSNVRPLVTLACGLAGHYGGEIAAFCVVKNRIEAELGGERGLLAQAQQRLALAVEAAHRWEVPVRTEIVANGDVSEAIVQKTRELRSDMLVMGWRGGRSTRAGARAEDLDRVVEHAGCDVAILKPAPQARAFRRILVADLRGEHAARATQVGLALADRFDGELHRLELVRPEPAAASPESVRILHAEGGTPGERPSVMAAHSVTEGILGAARGFDLVIVGTGRPNLSRQLLYGNRLEAIARRANASILVVRSAEQR